MKYSVVAWDEETVGANRCIRGHDIATTPQDFLSTLNPLTTIGDQILEGLDAHQVGATEVQAVCMVKRLTEFGLDDLAAIGLHCFCRLSGGRVSAS